MERTAPKPPGSRRRKAPTADAGLPDDDRFTPHPGQRIDAVYVIARGAELVIARPLPVLAVLLASAVLSGLLLLALVAAGAMSNPLVAAVGIDGTTHPAAILLLFVLGWAGSLLLQTPLVGSAIEIHTARRGLHAEFLQRGLARMGDLVTAGLAMLGLCAGVLVAGVLAQLLVVTITSLIPWLVVAVMLQVAGLVMVVTTCLRIITCFGLVVPVIVVEQRPASEALRRAWALGWPSSTALLLGFLLPALVVQGMLYVFGFLPAFISIPVTLVLGLGLAAYQAALVPAAYVAIREYVDGLDPGQLLARGGRR